MKPVNLKALALSLGITWGAALMILGWVAIFGWGVEAVDVLSSFYIGYSPSFAGGIAGAIWGFIDGAVGGLIIGFLYNYFNGKDFMEPKKETKTAKKVEAKKETKPAKKAETKKSAPGKKSTAGKKSSPKKNSGK